jgi:hypothetical protein
MADRQISYRRDITGEESDWLRVRFTLRAGRVLRFAVQDETVIDGRAYAVVRYDARRRLPARLRTCQA